MTWYGLEKGHIQFQYWKLDTFIVVIITYLTAAKFDQEAITFPITEVIEHNG